MSVNTYKRGCHLLNHDDVIGTRRVSYILYMPLPYGTQWEPAWGGALEMYDTESGPCGVLEPTTIPTKSIPPSWNQFIFFEVQPGHSFHSVEEVVVDPTDGRQRLSISGWFHTAQEGEEGYDPSPAAESKSSLEQLVRPRFISMSLSPANIVIQTTSFTPLEAYPGDEEDQFLPPQKLSKSDMSALSEFVNPIYLHPRTMKALAQRFVEESSLELYDFLAEPLAARLDTGLREQDATDGLGPNRATRMPPHAAGSSTAWTIAGPPHKRRHCILAPTSDTESPTLLAADADSTSQLRAVQDALLAGPAFRTWLAIITSLVPTKRASQARRFRPGLDYTLATSEQGEARLDVVLGLTPSAAGSPSIKEDEEMSEEGSKNIWDSGLWGGWECYMAPHEEEEDPAVYRASSKKAASVAHGREDDKPASGLNGLESKSQNGARTKGVTEDIEEDADTDDDETDDSTLLTVQPGFNRLLIVLRDEGVMHFVKYVSAAAEGSRWDVCGEYEVGVVAADDDDDE
jgi:hypothetical protein